MCAESPVSVLDALVGSAVVPSLLESYGKVGGSLFSPPTPPHMEIQVRHESRLWLWLTYILSSITDS